MTPLHRAILTALALVTPLWALVVLAAWAVAR